MTLETANITEFAACVGGEFRIHLDPATAIPVELVSVASLGFAPRPGGARAERESFSLLFRTPLNWRHPQRIYRLSHDSLGELEIFLVPVGPDGKGMQLEAIFNFV